MYKLHLRDEIGDLQAWATLGCGTSDAPVDEVEAFLIELRSHGGAMSPAFLERFLKLLRELPKPHGPKLEASNSTGQARNGFGFLNHPIWGPSSHMS